MVWIYIWVEPREISLAPVGREFFCHQGAHYATQYRERSFRAIKRHILCDRGQMFFVCRSIKERYMRRSITSVLCE